MSSIHLRKRIRSVEPFSFPKDVKHEKIHECFVLNRCDKFSSSFHSSRFGATTVITEVRFEGQPSMDYFLWEFTRVGLQLTRGHWIIIELLILFYIYTQTYKEHAELQNMILQSTNINLRQTLQHKPLYMTLSNEKIRLFANAEN